MIIAAGLLAGGIAMFVGQVWWDLTWSDTWRFALIAFAFILPSLAGASVQAEFLGRADRDAKGKSAGERLFEKNPVLFFAPWVLASVLAAALIVEIHYLD
jgi:hypothetical protein